MLCITSLCTTAYAGCSNQTIKDEDNDVSYNLSYEDYLYDGTGNYFMASVSDVNIIARKGESPSGRVTFRLKCRNKDDRWVHAEFSWGGKDTDCTKKYTASFKSTYDKVEVPVTLTREATTGHTWGSTWSMVSGSTTQHERKCTHPVCVQTDVCEAAWTSCTSNENGTHTFTCADGHKVTVACSGGEATCSAAAVCKDCGDSYGSTNPNNHKEATEATCVARATCELCGQPYGSIAPENHLPGDEATCTTAQICIREGCGKVLVSALGHDETGDEATCTTDKVCNRDDCEYVLVKALGHDESGKEATCTTDKVCAREGCGYVLVEALGHDESGDEATCTTDKVCNREGCDHVLVPALGHILKVENKVDATCTKAGYIDSVCTREDCGMPVHEDLKALGHWYDPWFSNGDGTHSAACKRKGCKHVGTTDCTEWEVTVNDVVYTVCPVCGELGTDEMDAIEKATISCKRKPKGEVIVRGMEAPFEGTLYAFTAGYEYAGRMQEIKSSPITIALPLNAEIGEFTLVRVDVTPETEETERAEVWTELAYTLEDGVLSFETETDGLFLLLPVETDA